MNFRHPLRAPRRRSAAMLPAALAACLVLAFGPVAAQERDAERERERAAAETARDQARAAAEQARSSGDAARAEADARRAAMAAARAELRDASRRVAELSEQLARDQVAIAMRDASFGRPVIGIVMSQDEDGVRLAGVTPDSPAARAGLRAGDRIIEINGKEVSGDNAGKRLEQAHRLIGPLREGDSVQLTIERDGKRQDHRLEAEMLPGLVWARRALDGLELDLIEPLVAPRLALEFGDITPFSRCREEGDCRLDPLLMALRWRDLRLATVEPELGRYFGTERGVLVLRAEGKAGDLQPGDVLLEVGGETVSTPDEVMRQLGEVEPGARVDAEILRDRRTMKIELEAPALARWPLPPPPPPAPAPPAPPRAAAPPEPPAPPAPPRREGILERTLR